MTTEPTNTHSPAPAAEPLALRLSEGLGPLVACPLCGGHGGYELLLGSTYRWWWVRCVDCGSDLAECRADRALMPGQPFPKRWPAADCSWNELGAYADKLHAALWQLHKLLRDGRVQGVTRADGVALANAAIKAAAALGPNGRVEPA
jgi:hypothetical protein